MYTQEWEKIQAFEDKGLFREALSEVRKITVEAIANQEHNQIIKALLFELKFNGYLEEDDYVEMISRIEVVINQVASPVKEILYSILGEAYWGYYSHNSWEFYERTDGADENEPNIRLWGLKRIGREITKSYQLSLENSQQTLSLDLTDFSEIILHVEESKLKCPTLYDFLSRRALDFYVTNRVESVELDKDFSLDSEAYFASNENFADLKIESKNQQNLKYRSLLIYKDLIRINTEKGNEQVLFYLEFERLKFLKEKATLSDKNQLFYTRMLQLAETYGNYDFAANAYYEIAALQESESADHSLQNSKVKNWSKRKAHEICQQTIELYPDTIGSGNCRRLKQKIESKFLILKAEEGLIPNRVSKFQLGYANVNKVYLKVIKIPLNERNPVGKSRNNIARKIKRQPGIHTETIRLKDPGDFITHFVELRIPELDPGLYYLAISEDGSFNHETEGQTHVPFWVTNFTFRERNIDGNIQLVFSDRATGKSISGAEVDIEIAGSGKQRKQTFNYTSDENGMVFFPKLSGHNRLNIIMRHNDEVFAPNQNYYVYDYGGRQSNTADTHFFTDRRIYRPGQKVYFKGIVVASNRKEKKLLPGHKSTVVLKDPNRQEIGTIEVETNRFGSFEGSFVIPQTLTGRFHISNPMGSVEFDVEEYKRPTFAVSLMSPEIEMNVNDTIEISGLAQTFAGPGVDNGKVRYRITRGVEYNRYYWRIVQHADPARDITEGELIADETGAFKIKFEALPDKTCDPETLPIFNFTLEVDVTDRAGETRSTSHSIKIGYQSLNLSNNLMEDIRKDEPLDIRILTTNLNGQNITAKGKVEIHKLKSPDRVYYPRLWNQPDMETWSNEQFEDLFPQEPFGEEHKVENWMIDNSVFTSTFDTGITDILQVDMKSWSPGNYVYEAISIDGRGKEIKDRFKFTIFSPSDVVIPGNDVLWVKGLEEKAEPGDTITVLVGTAEDEIQLLYDMESLKNPVESLQSQLRRGLHKLEFQIEEKHRGGFSIMFSSIRNNRHFQERFYIDVPYSNKDLDLSFSSFRSKLLPGAAEEWVLNISSKIGEQRQAEVLAAMYDASLDSIVEANTFDFSVFDSFYGMSYWGHPADIGEVRAHAYERPYYHEIHIEKHKLPELNYFGWSAIHYGAVALVGGAGGGRRYSSSSIHELERGVAAGGTYAGGRRLKIQAKMSKVAAPSGIDATPHEVTAETSWMEAGESIELNEISGPGNGDLSGVKIRSNFNETAFFYPQLTTDESGDVKIKFTLPESLTKWRFLGLAHNEDLQIGGIMGEVIAQKDLMLSPTLPRFLREGDEVILAAKISNISKDTLEGSVQLLLSNPEDDSECNLAFELKDANQPFVVEKDRSTVAFWKIKIPDGIPVVKLKMIAKTDRFTDGEEHILPVLSNRTLVTESLPLPVRGHESKIFEFKKLEDSGSKDTLKHHRFSLEFTSNPAWYAIQAMPYLMEFPHDCAEQVFSRYYSNAIASHILNSNPKIKAVMEEWRSESPEVFFSDLQKNQNLKSVILEETPWVLDAKNEAASKRNLALLMDMDAMSGRMEKSFQKIVDKQGDSGGWSWFPDMKSSLYMTQHMVAGMGHLERLGVKSIRERHEGEDMIEAAVRFMDRHLVKGFKQQKTRNKDFPKGKHLGYFELQYLYARSFFLDLEMTEEVSEILNFYKDQAKKYWLEFNLCGQAMIALSAHRFGMEELSTDIVKSLKDRSIQHEEFGMYWKDYQVGYYWYQAPIETQALMIEMFDEVTNDQAAVEELKIWLLKQKQTTNWKTTKQTTEAVYALLLKGSDLLASDALVEITVGGKAIEYVDEPSGNDPYQVKAQSGTGYFKTAWDSEQVKPEMGDIKVTKKSDGVAWGAAYWQYFEDLDKITFAETNLKLKKDLFLVEVTNNGEQLKPINENNVLTVGEKVRVRVELRTDRNLEYVHMKDMRASGFEPIDVLSRYRYRDGLGYYQSTKDAATHFFFDYIPKGTYVFEYDLRVQHKGDFSNGIASIQCMYAPEFTAHSNGIRVMVE